MEWIEAYPQDTQPTPEQIARFIRIPQWEALGRWLGETYGVPPSVQYSGCAGQPGWNVRYRKSGKTLCTLYPMDGFFVALAVIGPKQREAADLLAPTLSAYARELYDNASDAVMGQKWLMLRVDGDEVLADAMELIRLRVPPKPARK